MKANLNIGDEIHFLCRSDNVWFVGEVFWKPTVKSKYYRGVSWFISAPIVSAFPWPTIKN